MQAAKKHLLLFGGGGIEKFTGGDNAFLDEFDYFQLDRENLLKAADDLTNGSYWTTDGVTPTEPSTGIFRLTKTAAADKYIAQIMTNWFPKWAGYVSVVVSVQSDDLTAMSVALLDDGADAVTSAEVISGNANVAVASSIANITSIDGSPSKVRITGSVKSWAASVAIRYYPDKAGTTAGYVETSLSQVILGDQPDEKPRPFAQETAYPRMAYHPNWLKTKDGSARAHVVDTEGLVWCGEQTDGKIAPATATQFNVSAGSSVTQHWTFESGALQSVSQKYIDANNKLSAHIRSNGDLRIQKIISGTPTNTDFVGLATDGEYYRLRTNYDAATGEFSVYFDDKYIGAITATEFQTTTIGQVDHNLATNDLRIVAETNPKGNGCITAGGKTTPAYGDPGMWHTKPDGSAFAVGASSAMLVTAKTWVAAKDATFGFDSNTAGALVEPRLLLTSDELNADTAGGNETPQAWAAGAEMSFMQLLRSDTHGSHFLTHESGKQWKLFNANADAIPAASAYPAISNYDAALSLTRIALLDLSSWVERDFAEVTDTDASPVATDEIDRTAGSAQINLGAITLPSAGSIAFQARRVDASNFTTMYIDSTGEVTVKETIATVEGSALVTIAGAVTSTNEMVLVDDDGALEINVENVDKGSAALTDHEEAVLCRLDSLGTGGAVASMESHPFPALGLATGRIVAPQDGDTADCPSDNAVYIRNLTLASSGSGVYLDRRYKDSNNSHFMQLASDGECYDYKIVEGASTEMWAMAIGVVQDGDTILATLDGVKSEGFLNGASEGSSVLAGHLNETGAVFSNDRDFVCDAIEFRPLYHNLPFRL